MDIFQFWKYIVALARVRVSSKYFPVLVMVRVSSGYFPVLECISYSTQDCFSLGLGLAVSIFQFWNVYHTVRKKEIVALAVVRVSSGYFRV